MARIARRKLDQTWRDCVQSRGREFGAEAGCLAAFQAGREAGLSEAEAAYGALEAFGCLWEVSLPDETVTAPQAPVRSD